LLSSPNMPRATRASRAAAAAKSKAAQDAVAPEQDSLPASGDRPKPDTKADEVPHDDADAPEGSKKDPQGEDFPKDDPDELYALVKAAHDELAERDDQKPEDQDDPRLEYLAKQLTLPHVMSSTDGRIRRLNARTLVHLLYLYAPVVPFDNTTIKRMFVLLIQQLQGLVSNVETLAYEAAEYILSKMAICNTALLLLDVEQEDRATGVEVGMESADELILRLFDTILDSISAQHPHTVESDCLAVLAGVVEEHDAVTPLLLDTLLGRLLPDKRRDSEGAFQLASKVVARCHEQLREPVSAFVNNAIAGGDMALVGADGDEAVMSELSDHVHDLIYALHSIQPGLLLYILPTLCNQLEVDDLEMRFKAVQLLCLVFHSSPLSYAVDNDRAWDALSRRVEDKAVDIRYEMIKFVGFMMGEHESRQVFSRHFVSKLSLTDAMRQAEAMAVSHDNDAKAKEQSDVVNNG
jgi:hypothetical protein